jgi:hypothetical protein
MEPLVVKLLSPDSEDQQQVQQQEQTLWLVGALAQYLPDIYLLPIAKAVSQRVDQIAQSLPGSTATTAPSIALSVSPLLLQVWIQQLTQTSQTAVHSYLLKALLRAIQIKGPSLAQPSMQLLTEIWNHHWTNQQQQQSHQPNSSIVTVRCATVFISCLDVLGDLAMVYAQQAGATRLFSQMLQPSHPDPLLQLSILDLLSPHNFPTTIRNSSSSSNHQYHHWPTSTKAWLTSPDILTPIMKMLEDDPLLAGPALQCTSWLVAVAANSNTVEEGSINDDDDDDEAQAAMVPICLRVFQVIRDEVGTTSNESDRLSVVQSLVELSKVSPHDLLENTILVDPQLRGAWWDMTRLSSPKLQAAILASVAQVLQVLAALGEGEHVRSSVPTFDEASNKKTRIGLRIYTCLGLDNGMGGETKMNHNTTDWLYTKYIQSPMPELRIATYAIWEAVAALSSPISNGITLLSASQHFWNHMLDGGRETTNEARIAKYHVLETLHHHHGQSQNNYNATTTTATSSYLSKALCSKLEQLIGLGPHGMQAQHYDVAIE